MSHWVLHPFRSRSHKSFLVGVPIDSCEDKKQPVLGIEAVSAVVKITSVKFGEFGGGDGRERLAGGRV